MESPADHDGLTRLRHRFLLEEPARITEWLWNEHPQAAAFLLNWLGDSQLLSAYLKPLPSLQQADILYRIASLEPDAAPSPFQEEVLVGTLRRLSPYLREAGAELSQEDPEPLRGERLYLGYLAQLAAEDRRNLIASMEEVDPVLARLGANLTPEPGEAGGKGRTFHGLANTYADWIGIALSRRRLAGALAFADTVEMVSGTGYTSEAPAMLIPFRLVHPKLESGLYLLLSPTLLFHYLECAFGAPHPRFLHEANKAEFSEMESRVGVSLAALLAEGLGSIFGVNGPDGNYQGEPVDAAQLGEELAEYGKTPFLSCQYTIKLGHAVAGRIGLLIPPSHLRALRAMTGSELFENLLPETLPALPRKTGGGRKRGRKGAAAAAPPAPKSASGEDDPSLSLEEFLWRIELEEAEKAGTRPGNRPPQPIDLLLQGYDPKQIAKEGKRSREENDRVADLHYQYGARFFQISQYGEATEALERALAAKADHEGGQLLMAAAWGEQGMYFREILAYKKMISENVALTEAHVLLARRLSFLGRADESYQALSGAIERGFQPKEIVEADPCFKSLRRAVKWRQYLADQS